MAINSQVLSMLLNEHCYRPITGRYLNVGKQTISITPETLRSLFDQYGLDRSHLDELLDNEVHDQATRWAHKFGIVGMADHDLLACFSDAEYLCADRSDYEGASIIVDMNDTVPAEYHAQFDFIYTGGTGDNVFDPVMFIRNTARMLKPGGRILHMEAAAGYPGAFLMYSPEWLYSFYALNDFVDCKAYVMVSRSSAGNRYFFESDLFQWTPDFTRDPNFNYVDSCKSIDGMMFLLVVAEKGADSSVDKTPIQIQYLDDGATDWRLRQDDFSKSPRPKLTASEKRENVVLPYLSDHHKYLGSGF